MSGPAKASATHLPPAFPGRAPWGTAARLRAWQADALEQYRASQPRDFLAVATPGAGKTTFALQVAADLLTSRVVRRVTVVAPTEHLKRQWADAAARANIALDPAFTNAQGRHGSQFDGVAVTYAQVASKPLLHEARTLAEPTLVILDEIHHGGDALSWGEAIRVAFAGATRRLSLTGTPFRSDTAPIPFVTYQPDAEGVRRSVADFTYGYGDALRDNVVRPVIFMAYRGQMRWRTRAGDELSAELGSPLTKDLTAQAWRTALDPKGEWMSAVLRAADTRLTEVRRGMPDAAGLVIASDQSAARAYAGILRTITGRSATVVLSDDPGSSARIEEFAGSTDRWMVAVRMVSEGVDVPRLAVGVYATSASTPLFFAQAIGRFVRARRRGETASVFLPSVPDLLQLAGQLETERDHALDRALTPDEKGREFSPEDALVAAANKSNNGPGMGDFEALEAQASFDRVLFDGGEFGLGAEVGSEEEADFLGIPGLLDADQVATLLRQRQATQARKAARPSARPRGREGTARQACAEPARQTATGSVVDHRELAALRKELHALVASWSRRSGEPHAAIHARLRTACGGPPVPMASAAQIRERVALLREWFVGRG